MFTAYNTTNISVLIVLLVLRDLKTAYISALYIANKNE